MIQIVEGGLDECVIFTLLNPLENETSNNCLATLCLWSCHNSKIDWWFWETQIWANICCLLKSLGTNPIIVTFAVANIFWSTNWWLGKLWGSSRSSVKTRWLRRWLGVRSMMVALAVSIGIPRSMLCWHCSESYHFVEQLPPQLPDPHYPMPRKIATQKHRIDRRTKSHENTWNAKSHLPQNEVFILKSLRRDDTIHRRFF